jgi:hypothetical protein
MGSAWGDKSLAAAAVVAAAVVAAVAAVPLLRWLLQVQAPLFWSLYAVIALLLQKRLQFHLAFVCADIASFRK